MTGYQQFIRRTIDQSTHQNFAPGHTNISRACEHYLVGSAGRAHDGTLCRRRNGFDLSLQKVQLQCYAQVHPPIVHSKIHLSHRENQRI